MERITSKRDQKQNPGGKVAEFSLESLFDYLTDPIVLCNSHYEIIESNKSANVILGKGDSLVGSKCYETFRGKREPCPDCPLSVSIESGKVVPLNTYDERFGEYFEERTHPIMSDDRELRGFVLTSRNVSKIREMENKFAQAKKLAAIGQVSSGVAHDFNNVLTGVLGRIQILKKQVTDSELLKHLEVMEKAARDGAQTVRRIQDFTRAKREVTFAPVDLKHRIEEVIELTRPKYQQDPPKKGTIIEIVLDLEDGLYIMGNPSDLDNAFTNVIFNAVDAMPEGGVLSIRTRAEGHRAVVKFKDTGIGMTEEIKEKIFDPFFTTKDTKGTGLGMSEVYGVVKRHEGRIGVESEIGRGTQVTLSFPVAEEKPEEAVPEEIREFTSSRILVIDDEEYVLDVIKDVLTDSGHHVTGFTSAQDGITHFRERHQDIVITDLRMPQMSGQEVARRIKRIDEKTPVILLSGWAVNLEEEKDLEKVVDFAITKPFSVEGIQEVVTRATLLSRRLKNQETGN